MNFWHEPSLAAQSAMAGPDPAAHACWQRLRLDEAAGLNAVCAARLAMGDLILQRVPMANHGFNASIRQQLADFAVRHRISVDTADQYRRVSAWYTAQHRAALATTGIAASYTLLREVALHTRGSDITGAGRFQTLLSTLRQAAAAGAVSLSCREYLIRSGRSVSEQAGGSAPPSENLVRSGNEAQPVLPQAIDAAVRTLAADPAGPERFFEELAAEGGLEALQSASFALRKAKADAKSRDEAVFGADVTPGPFEETLTLILRAMKALKKPLGLDPQQIVQALPPDQFAELSELCGSVHHWHELLIHAARASNHQKGSAA